jgi:hypothetical protein
LTAGALAALSTLLGCSDADTGGTGAGGTGGAGGGTTTTQGAKPVCEGEPSGSAVPDARADAAAAFDATGTTVVLYGGDTAIPVCGDVPKRTHVGDTWILDPACGDWVELSVAGPGTRARHAMATDVAGNRAILFGGRTRTGSSGAYTVFDDVWAFDFTSRTWSELATTGTGPSARYNAGVAVLGGKLYVFGGSTDTTGLNFEPQDDLFALDLGTLAWEQVTVSSMVPPARLFHATAADEQSGKLFVYSGGDANAFTGPFLPCTWAFDAGTNAWSEIVANRSAIEDSARIKLGMLARPTEQGPTLYFFGGHDDGALGNRNDVGALDSGAGAWRLAQAGDVANAPSNGACDFPADFTTIDEASPERRSSFAFAARPDGSSFVVFGGDSDCGRLNDAWWFDAIAEKWTPVRSTLAGVVCGRTGSTSCQSLCQ